jgi:hypothetical protein
MRKLNRKARRLALQSTAPHRAGRQTTTAEPWPPAIAAEIARGDRLVVAMGNYIAQSLHDAADVPDTEAHYSESLVRVCLANATRALGHVLAEACAHYGIALPVDMVIYSTVTTKETMELTAKALQDYGIDPKTFMASARPGQVIDSVHVRFTDIRLSNEERELPIAVLSSTLHPEKTMPPDERPDNEGAWERMRAGEEREPTERTAVALTQMVLFDAALRLPGRVTPSPGYWSPPITGTAPGRVGGATMGFTMLHEPIPGTIVSTSFTLCMDQMVKLATKLDKKPH